MAIESEKYLYELGISRPPKFLGREGFERGQIHKSGLSSPRMFFIKSEFFEEFLAEHDFSLRNKGVLSYDEIEEISEMIRKSRLPEKLEDIINDKYKEWRVEDKHLMVEVRLSNVDENVRYIEKMKSIMVRNLDDLILEIKRSFIQGLKFRLSEIVVQVTQVYSYDVTGFLYLNKTSGEVEIDSVYGLWFNDEKIEYYDYCLANLETLGIKKYVTSNQREMFLKNGDKIEKVEVAENWRKADKISLTKLKELLNKSKTLLSLIDESFEFSFGIYKNKIYIHDLKKLADGSEDNGYYFSDDFLEFAKQNGDFKSQADIISKIELPSFLQEDVSEVKMRIDRSSEKGLFVDRLKEGIKKLPKLESDFYYKVQKLNDIFEMEGRVKGFLIDFDILMSVANDFESKNSEEVFRIINQNVSSAERYIKSVSKVDGEIILKFSRLLSDNDDSFNNKYFTKTIDLLSLKRLSSEILIFKKIFKDRNYKNFSISLPHLRTFEEMDFVINILGLSKDVSIQEDRIKLYVDLSIPSMLFEYSGNTIPIKYLLDGIIIDFSLFLQNFFQKKLFTPRDYKIGSEYLQQNLDSIQNKIKDLRIIAFEDEFEYLEKLNPSVIIRKG